MEFLDLSKVWVPNSHGEQVLSNDPNDVLPAVCDTYTKWFQSQCDLLTTFGVQEDELPKLDLTRLPANQHWLAHAFPPPYPSLHRN